jgi:DNA-binding IclR family transcriptional regulator
MNTKDNSFYAIKSVNNLLNVIEELAQVESAGVTELSTKLGLHKNNVFRLLANLEERGYVSQDAVSEKYHLTSKFNQLGAQITVQSMGRIKSLVATLSQVVDEADPNTTAKASGPVQNLCVDEETNNIGGPASRVFGIE